MWRCNLVERLRQLPADIRQLKIEEIGMTRFEIVEQGRYADFFIGIELSVNKVISADSGDTYYDEYVDEESENV